VVGSGVQGVTATTAVESQYAPGWRKWVPSAAMMLSGILSYMDRQTLAVLSPMILQDTHLSTQAYATALSIFSIFYMIGNPLWGSLLDFIGLRAGMFAALIIRTVATASHAGLSGFVGFSVARGVLGFGEGSVFPAALKAAADSLPPNRQARGMAVGYSGASLGALITPLIVIPFAIRFGWRSAFLFTASLGVCWLVMWAIIARPPYLREHKRELVKLAWPNLMERRLWLVVSSFGLGAVALGVVSYLSALYLNRALGVSQARLGEILWIPMIGWEIGYYFWGWIADLFVVRGKRPSGLFILLAVLALPIAFMTWTHSWVIALLQFFWALFIADGYVVLSLRVGSHLYPRGQTAMVAGIGSGAWSAVLAAVLPVYGRWFDLQWYNATFVSMALLPLAGTLIWLWLSRPEALWREAAERVD